MMATLGWILAFIFGFYALRNYSALMYQQAINIEILGDWAVSDAVEAKNVVDILVDNGVPHKVVNHFKDRYRCLSLQLQSNTVRQLDTTPVKNNVELLGS